MGHTLKFDCNGVDWNEAAEVFVRAPLGMRIPGRLKKAFEASHTVCFAYHGETLIGLGRAISDGVYQAAIYDLCILPEYQGQGLGNGMMKAILDKLDVEHVILYSVPGKEAFYEKLGFSRMLTAMSCHRDPSKLIAGGYIES
ncbi:GCN5-related N-acetyltransferase [Desulfovibrio ferrophilus]|uniref:GCN5-related N-acetyltransferase n=2 Tax=Desulfovibrio ferrophilus TaxID=241368 RepID=A0A2Z6AU66_9BACT|nr:GCN5-related N-acetyltransferase [Desulfovibrio ferrophilus]